MKNMKKFAFALAAVCMVGLMPMTAMAHGGHHGYSGTASSTGYRLCTVKNCTKTGIHKHNGVYCAPHSSTDGHKYHH